MGAPAQMQAQQLRPGPCLALLLPQEDFKGVVAAQEGWQYAAQRPEAKSFVEQKWGWVSSAPGALLWMPSPFRVGSVGSLLAANLQPTCDAGAACAALLWGPERGAGTWRLTLDATDMGRAAALAGH